MSCGGHSAENCGKCGNNAGMCNGDCTWKNKRCVFHCREREFNRYIFHFQGANFNWRIGAKAGLNIHGNGGGYYRRSK